MVFSAGGAYGVATGLTRPGIRSIVAWNSFLTSDYLGPDKQEWSPAAKIRAGSPPVLVVRSQRDFPELNAATETFLAEAAIEVGHHETANWFGLTVNTDTVLATVIAAVIVIGLAFFLRAKVTSTGVPGGVQLFWEAITVQLRDQIETAIGMKIAPFVLPLAVTLFVFILVANWLSVLPVQYTDGTGATHELLKPPASDINFVLALALFVFICYHAAGIWRRGIIGYPVKLLKGHVAFLAPILVNVVCSSMGE